MSELEKFDFSDIFPDEKSEFVRFDDVKNMINQPQLTIPKSVADELDSDNLFDFVDRVKGPSDLPSKSARYVYSQAYRDWYYIMVSYLNPFTRDSVKVVDE